MVCKHFGVCGGCAFQDLPYQEQLHVKQATLENILKPCLGRPAAVGAIIPSPRVHFYRNKMEFSFAQGQGHIACGLHSRVKKRDIVDLEECLIFSEDTFSLLESIKAFFQGQKATVYDNFSRQGLLRHLVLREAKNLDQCMVNVVTSSQSRFDTAGLTQCIRGLNLSKKVTSLVWTVNDSLSDAVVPEQTHVLLGNDFIEEKIHGLKFRIFPYSFFQVNPAILEDFYTILKAFLSLRGNETVLDLFSGMGMISLILARSCTHIRAVEVNAQATENARLNASLNGIDNLSLLTGKVRKVLYDNMHVWVGKIDVVVINPPRSGISQKIIERIKQINPGKIIYSSCNPKTFAQDVKEFLDIYDIVSLQPFDFFPHTPHLELLGFMVRK